MYPFLYALGNERTLVTCISCESEALLKDLHATSVLSFPIANEKYVLPSLYLCLSDENPLKSRKNQCQFFRHVTSVFHW